MDYVFFRIGNKSDWSKEGKQIGSLKFANRQVIEELNPDDMTYVCHLRGIAKRTFGVYRLGTAEGTLEYVNLGDKDNIDFAYRLSMKFTNIIDGQKLYEEVFGGTLRPVISFEGPQVKYRFPENFSEEQVKISELIIRGLTDHEIASKVGKSPAQIAAMVKEILKLSDCRNRVEFAVSRFLG